MLRRSNPAARPARPLRSASLAAALLCAVSLVACGGVEGKYSHVETMDGEELAISIALESGGKAVWTMGGSGNTMTSEGTYTVDGDEVTVTIQGDSTVFTRQGKKLVGELMGEQLELVRE